MKLGEAMYKAQQEAGAAPGGAPGGGAQGGGAQGGASGGGPKDGVVDADFEEVDGDNKKPK